MANETKKLDAVQLSQLPVIDDPQGFWIFGSKSEEGGAFRSGRYLFDKLEEYARNLQLERRISLTMETRRTEMFIGEEMTIYKVDTMNVKSLTINGETFTDLNNRVINKKIDTMSLLILEVEHQLTDPKAHLFIYAKAKIV